MNEEFEFPEELVDAVHVFDDVINQKIIRILIVENQKIPYTDLKEKMELSDNLLNKHLDILVGSALVICKAKLSDLRRVASTYELSTYGEMFIYNLLSPFVDAEKI